MPEREVCETGVCWSSLKSSLKVPLAPAAGKNVFQVGGHERTATAGNSRDP